jgi:hypothetical protein
MRRALATPLSCLAVAAFVGSLSPAALADPTSEERVAARTLFEEGRALMKKQQFAQACPKLEESQRLDPGIGTLFNVADCYEGLGRVASAWTTFLDVAEASQRLGESDRARVAKGRADALAPRLPRVRITVNAHPGVKVTLDHKPFAAQLVDTPVPIDPGDHVVTADAAGKKHWENRFRAVPLTSGTVVVPVLEDEALPPPPATVSVAPAPLPPPPPPPAAPPPASRWQVPVAITATGLGVVGLGLGTAFGFAAMSDWSSAKPDCVNGRCTTSAAYSSWSSAHSAGVASTASFVAGGVLVAAGVVVWVTRPRAPVAVGVRSDGAVVVGGRFP